MVDLQYNFPLLPDQAEQWNERLRQALEALQPAGMNELRPTFRIDQRAQRELAAEWMRSSPAATWITCGGHHGSLVALLAGGFAGKTLAVDEVTYGGILDQARMLACPLVSCAVDEQGMRADALQAACERARAEGEPVSAIYTMPTVHNPLGVTASEKRRMEIVAVARRFELCLIEDDAYGFMDPEAPPSYAVLAPERTFLVRGLSKSYAPATRTGFLVAPERYAGRIEGALKTTATGTSHLHNVAALSLIADGTLDQIIAEKLTEGAQRNAEARSVLGAHCAPGAACVWHLWLHLPEGVRPEVFEQRMLDRAVAISGGHWFAVHPQRARGVRIALGGEVERARVMQGVAAVAEELAQTGSKADVPSA